MKKLITILLIINFQFLISNCQAQSPVDSVASGCALDFNGVSNWVSIPNSAVNFGSSSLTIEFWYKSPPLTQTKAVITNRNDGCCCATNTWWILTSTNFIYFSIGDIQAIPISSTTLNDNTWHHIAFTRSATEMKSYKDGVLVLTKPYPIKNIGAGGVGRVGVSPCSSFWSGGGRFSGELDELRFWNKALTQTEIQQNMCKKLTGTEPNLVGYWRFDDCGGLTATDASGNGNHGTLN